MTIQHKSIPIEDEGQAGEVQLVLDQDDPDDIGGYVFGEGGDEEWHKEACPCELCRVERLELIERVLAGQPICEGEDCQGCGNCPEVKHGRPLDDIIKEEDEWLIALLNTTNPEVTPDYWRTEVESGAFNLPLLPFPPPPSPYPGFEEYVRAIEPKGETLPVLLKRSDGATILYANKFNTIFAEPGMVKTWMGIEAALASVALGGRVLWWDFEDKPDTLHDRVKALGELGLIKGPNVAFVDYNLQDFDDSGVALQALANAIEWLAEAGQYSLVVIDAAESSGAPSDGAPVTEWFKNMLDPFRRRKRSVGVLVLDHVPKQRRDRPRGAIGSQAKLAKVDGAAFGLSGRPWTKTEDGVMTLRLEKDRPGDVPGRPGSRVATITGRTVNGKLTITIDPPTNNDDDVLDMPMMLLEAIGAAGAEGIKGVKTLYSKVKGKSQAKQEALSELIGDGLVVQSKSGQSKVLTITEEGLLVLGEGVE